MSTPATSQRSVGGFVEYRNASVTPRGTVASWPRPYAENPYLANLATAVAARGVTTRSHRYLAALVAAPGAARWLHVHWPEWMLDDVSRARSAARAAWFFALIDVARSRGLKIAWTAHNRIGHDHPHPDLGETHRRKWLARCDLVVGHFPSACDALRELGYTGRFVLAPHPHYADDYPAAPDRQAARRALGYPAGDTLLLALGAIEPYKALDSLAGAFVQNAPGNARLFVAGRASSDAAVRALRAAAGGDPRVRIETGFVDRERVALLHAAADAVVIAYREMFTSGAAMLALSFGVPVVGRPVHHLAGLRGESFFVPLDSLDALPRAIATVEGLDENARQRALEFARACSWERAALVLSDAMFPRAEAGA